jgi:hypothetical protein
VEVVAVVVGLDVKGVAGSVPVVVVVVVVVAVVEGIVAVVLVFTSSTSRSWCCYWLCVVIPRERTGFKATGCVFSRTNLVF